VADFWKEIGSMSKTDALVRAVCCRVATIANICECFGK
jgi:hypothetical protein